MDEQYSYLIASNALFKTILKYRQITCIPESQTPIRKCKKFKSILQFIREEKKKHEHIFFIDIDKGTNYTLQLITIRNIEIPKKYLDNN